MVLIGLVVIFSFATGNVSAASGDSIYVNGTSGNNVYNGQSAVYDGTNGPKATIKNATGTVNSNGTIHIAQGTYYESNIKINTNMTIIGENQKNTMINGQQSGQSIFTIASGVYLTIINITLTNATFDNGGAIYNYGKLNVYNSTFTNNNATDGGAISNGDDGALTIDNSTFNNNTGIYGGVIWNSGHSSTFTNNTFTNNIGTYGGVIYNEHTGTVIVTNNTFNNNTATKGGAIYNYGTSTETNNTFNNNTATNGGIGGAIYNQGPSTIINNTFNNNTANYGGAIYNSGVTLTIDNSTFTSNTANSGGAIYSTYNTLTVNNCTFTSNTVTNSGGAILCASTLTVNNSTFISNAAGFGGAIQNDEGTEINNSTFTSNTATNYGGAILNSGSVTVNNSTFTSNTAAYGGAIFIYDTSIVNNCTFTKNGATYGGSILSTGTLTVNNSTFTSNTANSDGGAIYNYVGRLTVNNSTFTSNTATYYGGAIYNNAGGVTVNNSTFTKNVATYGGAICNIKDTVTVKYSTFTKNGATYGGAIFNYGGTLNVSFCRIVGNTPEDIFSDGSSCDIDYNWWGSNFVGSDPVTAGRAVWITVSKWLVLTTTSDPNTINTGETSNITADLLHDQNGVYQNPIDGHVPDGIVVNFNSDALGSVNPLTGTLINGEASTIFTAGLNPGISTITSMVDQQTIPTAVTINKISPTIPTTIIVTPVSGLNGKTVNLKAKLTDSDGNTVTGASVQFSVNGTIIGSVNTDTNGIATLPYIITQTSGTYTILANYLGNNTYIASSNTNNLKVTPTPTSTVMNALIGNKGETVNLTATLTDTVHQLAISGETVKFLINGKLIGTAVTNSNGIAILPYTITQNGGYYYIDALFAGDNVYSSSTGGATLQVLQSNIYVTVTSSNSHPKMGETVKITFKVGNKGPDPANNVVLTLKIPEGMEYVSTTADTGLFTYNPTTRTITWNIGNVPVGDPKLILNIKVLKPGNYTIKPTITTTTYDPNILSNIGSKTINVSNNTTNPVQPVVNAETIPMQPTGTPIIPLIVGALMTLAGLVKTRKN